MGIPMPHGSGAPPMPRAYSSSGLRKSMSAASFASSTDSRAQSGDLKSQRLRAMAQAAGVQASEYISRSQARLQKALEWQMRMTASKAALALQAEVSRNRRSALGACMPAARGITASKTRVA